MLKLALNQGGVAPAPYHHREEIDVLLRRALTLVLVSAMAAGCAPLRPVEGRHLIHVSTARYPNPGQATPPAPIVGARCTVSNDLGSWSVTTPGVIEVAFSRAPFQVSCAHDGFKEDTQQLGCVSRRARATAAGAAVGLPLGAAAAVASVVAGPAVIIASVAGAPLLGGATGYALAGPDSEPCTVVFLMTPGS